MEKITIVGGGLSGSLMAIYLAKRGFTVDVFERRPDMRTNRISAGKSINLALSIRGIEALKKVGLDDEVLSDAIPMYGRMMHSRTGELNYQPYGTNNQAINSVSRGRLNLRLLELADAYDNINLHFNHKCKDVDIDKAIAVFENEKGESITHKADRIIGTDGAFAATRGRLQITDRFDYSQSYLYVGYKELIIPPDALGNFMMDKNCLHIWPRGAYMMIALPNPAGDFTLTLFLAHQGKPGFDQLNSKEAVLDFFKSEFADALPLMPTLQEDFFENPIGALVTVKCYPWVKADKLALMGDAAHAVVPFFGQGMNCSFEDCVVLDECIEKYYPNWTEVFSHYQELRKPNADAIADLAIQNFTEMAEKVGDVDFLLRKHIEHDLCEHFSDIFKSQYELVTFSTVPYAEAKARGAVNDKIIDEIIAKDLIDNIKGNDHVKSIIQKYIN